MSKELKITKGECSVSSNGVNRFMIVINHKDILSNDVNYGEQIENAKLFREAMNIANQTNKTPRQLLEERDRLLSMLIELLPYIETAELDEAYAKGHIRKLVNRLSKTIKDIES